MPNATQYAAALARAITRLKESPEGGEAQKQAMRALVATSDQRPATLRFYDSILTLDETELDPSMPAFGFLAECLKGHGVQEIVIGRGADAAELLALVRGLADTPGQGRIKERLRDAGSTRVMVISEQRDPLRRAPSVSQAFAKAALDDAVLDEWNQFLKKGNQNERAYAMPGVPESVQEALVQPPAPPPAPPQPGQTIPPLRTRAADPVPVAALPAVPTLAGVSPLALAVQDLQSDPYERDVLGRLTRAGKLIEDACAKDKAAEAIDALAEFARLEAAAQNEQARSPYAVILKRTLTRTVLTAVAPYVLDGRRAARATIVLRRAGEDAVDLLLGLIASGASLPERVAYGQVLRGMSGGPARLLRLLGRQEWQVVRNIAEVVGELLIEDGVSYLARLLDHDDQRVRRAALVSIARIGSPAAVEPVRHVLGNAPPEVKALVGGSMGGSHARAMVPLLAVAAEKEDRAELVRVYCLALGRIGTEEAVAALAALAEPGGRLLSRRSTSTRLAAIDGLKAAGAAAADVLERLSNAGDRTIAPAAQAARSSLPGRTSSQSR
jgi:hypothetical protein